MQSSARALDELYSEETETNRKFIIDPSIVMSRPISTAPRFDEASADNPQKTVRPPPSVEVEVPIDVHFESQESEAHQDDKTTPGASGRVPPRARNVREDEETETMQLTPELRERIEQMSKPQSAPHLPQAAPPVPPAPPRTAPPIDPPPETRRISKPQR
jgi:hypothetical protein